MAEAKMYPQESFTTFQTSTVLSCAACREEIAMYTPVVSDGVRHWHERCSPAPTVKKTIDETQSIAADKVAAEGE